MMWQNSPLKIIKAHVLSDKVKICERVIVQGLPAVATQEGLLVLDEVQPAGKKPMPGRAFLAGARGWVS
jgi:methionyl-tRNA formyltransferase